MSHTASMDVMNRAEKIRLLICDIDGVMTDGRLYFLGDGTEFKSFHARDGHGIKLLRQSALKQLLFREETRPRFKKEWIV